MVTILKHGQRNTMIKIKKVNQTGRNLYRCPVCGMLLEFVVVAPYECSSCKTFQPNIARLIAEVGQRREYHLTGFVDKQLYNQLVTKL